MTDAKNRPQEAPQKDKDLKNGPLAVGVKKDAGEKKYLKEAAAALDDPKADERGLGE